LEEEPQLKYVNNNAVISSIHPRLMIVAIIICPDRYVSGRRSAVSMGNFSGGFQPSPAETSVLHAPRPRLSLASSIELLAHQKLSSSSCHSSSFLLPRGQSLDNGAVKQSRVSKEIEAEKVAAAAVAGERGWFDIPVIRPRASGSILQLHQSVFSGCQLLVGERGRSTSRSCSQGTGSGSPEAPMASSSSEMLAWARECADRS
jgi:hypothetical protein